MSILTILNKQYACPCIVNYCKKNFITWLSILQSNFPLSIRMNGITAKKTLKWQSNSVDPTVFSINGNMYGLTMKKLISSPVKPTMAKRKKTKKSLRKTATTELKNYCKHTTLHGLKYLADSHLTFGERWYRLHISLTLIPKFQNILVRILFCCYWFGHLLHHNHLQQMAIQSGDNQFQPFWRWP